MFHKYGAKRTEIDGIKFDSKAESEYYLLLKREKDLGIIQDFEMQPKIYLTEAKILYKPDFFVITREGSFFVDVKGMKTPVFALKMRLWKHYGKGTLKIVKKSGKGFRLEKVIESISA